MTPKLQLLQRPILIQIKKTPPISCSINKAVRCSLRSNEELKLEKMHATSATPGARQTQLDAGKDPARFEMASGSDAWDHLIGARLDLNVYSDDETACLPAATISAEHKGSASQ